MKRFLLSTHGVTLIELVVATAVISVLTVLTMDFLVGQIVQNAVKNAQADLQLDAQLTLDAINQDIKHSANVDSPNRWEDPYAPDAPTDLFSWISDNTTVIMARPSTDSDNNILFEDPLTYITFKDNNIYYVDTEARLRKRILAAPVPGNNQSNTCADETAGCALDPVLAHNVVEFSIAYYSGTDTLVTPEDARSIQITLKLEKQLYNRTLDAEHVIRTVFRND